MKDTMVNKLYIFLAGAWLFMSSCSGPDVLSPDEYVQYVEDEEHGCTTSRELNGVLFTAKYEPLDYKVIRDARTMDSLLTPVVYQDLKNDMGGHCYFVFKIESPNHDKSPLKLIARTEEDKAKMMQYMQSRMQGDFYVESGTKKIPCALYHIEDDYNILNYSLISLSFDAHDIDLTKDLTLVYNDQVFQNGPVKFTITADNIQKLPKLKIS